MEWFLVNEAIFCREFFSFDLQKSGEKTLNKYDQIRFSHVHKCVHGDSEQERNLHKQKIKQFHRDVVVYVSV